MPNPYPLPPHLRYRYHGALRPHPSARHPTHLPTSFALATGVLLNLAAAFYLANAFIGAF